MKRHLLHTSTLAIAASLIAWLGDSGTGTASASSSARNGASCSLQNANVLAAGRLVRTPANGCDVWRINLAVGDQLVMRAAAESSTLFVGFLIPGLTDADIAADIGADDLRGTDCEMRVEPNQAGQTRCAIAGTHPYYLRAIQTAGASAQIGIYVKHAPVKAKPVVGTCNIFARPPFLRVGVTQFGESFQACPAGAIKQYTDTDKSLYPFVERWRLRIARGGQALILSGYLAGAAAAEDGYGQTLQVLKPGTDPADYPDPGVVFIPGRKEVCRLSVGERPAVTRCVFPRPGNYIVVLASGGSTLAFKFR